MDAPEHLLRSARMPPRQVVRPWRLRRAVAGAAIVAAAIVTACWPVTTRFGVDYRWSSKTLPLYEKALNFVSRDLQARRLSREVAAGGGSAEDVAIRIFRWVGTHVRRVPPGFPVVDDHLLHVIIRGYGAADQRTEVFALLASYAAIPATAVPLSVDAPERRRTIYVAVADVGGRLLVVDVENQILFRRDEGTLAYLDDLRRDPSPITRAGGHLIFNDMPYESYFTRLDTVRPVFSRMERQKPWPRLRLELTRLLVGSS